MVINGVIENSNGFNFYYIIEYVDLVFLLFSCILENIVERCVDGIDNDGDGLIDCDDLGCEVLVVGCVICFGDGLFFVDIVFIYVLISNNININNINLDKVIGVFDNCSISLG